MCSCTSFVQSYMWLYSDSTTQKPATRYIQQVKWVVVDLITHKFHQKTQPARFLSVCTECTSMCSGVGTTEWLGSTNMYMSEKIVYGNYV